MHNHRHLHAHMHIHSNVYILNNVVNVYRHFNLVIISYNFIVEINKGNIRSWW